MLLLIPPFTLSSSEQKEPVEMSSHPITDEDSQTHHTASASAAPVAPAAKERPKEPEEAGVEPAAAGHVSSKQTEEVPEILPEQVGSSGTLEQQQQPTGAEEEELARVGQEGLLDHQELVTQAEKELWATVEETAAEESKELSEEEQDKKEVGGVAGG